MHFEMQHGVDNMALDYRLALGVCQRVGNKFIHDERGVLSRTSPPGPPNEVRDEDASVVTCPGVVRDQEPSRFSHRHSINRQIESSRSRPYPRSKTTNHLTSIHLVPWRNSQLGIDPGRT
jgi:hypothetical protein